MIRETSLPETTPMSPARKNARLMIDRVSAKIENEEREILIVILQRRIAGETFEVIAEDPIFEQLDITSHEVRESIVTRVCNNLLDYQLHERIKGEIRSRRPSNLNDKARKKAQEARQLCEWTDEINNALAKAQRELVHETRNHYGAPDWNRIAAHMKNECGIDLTPHQWYLRGQRLRHRGKKEAPLEAEKSASTPSSEEGSDL